MKLSLMLHLLLRTNRFNKDDPKTMVEWNSEVSHTPAFIKTTSNGSNNRVSDICPGCGTVQQVGL